LIFWFFGNICAESCELRDHIMQRTDVVNKMSQIVVDKSIKLSMLRIISWLNSNLLRLKNVVNMNVRPSFDSHR
jgi:hypothetical protein